MKYLLLRPKIIIFFVIFISLLLNIISGNNYFLIAVISILSTWGWIIVSVYFQKRYNNSKAIKVPLSYKRGKLSDEVLNIIGDCTIERTKNKNKFILGVYDENYKVLLFEIKSKQFYTQIDCNANYGDFGLIIELNSNEKKDAFINWIKTNLPSFKYYINENDNKIVISLFSDFVFNKYNSPLIAEMLYEYLGLKEKTYIKSKYIY
jgi:hypothetical protein